MDSNPDHRQKTNIMSGRPQRLGIQKELAWDLVLQGTSARNWVRMPAHPKRIEVSSRRPATGEKPSEEVVCTPKETWNRVQEISMELRKNWSLRTIPALRFTSLNDPWQNDLEDWWLRARVMIRLVLDQIISLHAYIKELMYYSSTVYKEWQCIGIAPT